MKNLHNHHHDHPHHYHGDHHDHNHEEHYDWYHDHHNQNDYHSSRFGLLTARTKYLKLENLSYIFKLSQPEIPHQLIMIIMNMDIITIMKITIILQLLLTGKFALQECCRTGRFHRSSNSPGLGTCSSWWWWQIWWWYGNKYGGDMATNWWWYGDKYGEIMIRKMWSEWPGAEKRWQGWPS